MKPLQPLMKQFLEGKVSIFKGLNFEGKIKMKGDILRLDVTEYTQGRLYFVELKNSILKKSVENYLIFRKINDLFDELIENKQMAISEQGCLIVPIRVTFKVKNFDLTIRIPLAVRKFHDDEEEKQILITQMASKYAQNKKWQKILANNSKINFMGDSTNSNFGSFQITKNGKQIKMLAANVWQNYNHCLPLPNAGMYYFRFKIITTATKSIFIGVCEKEVKGQANIYKSAYFIGLNIYNGYIYCNNATKPLTGFIEPSEKAVLKLEIDMTEKMLKWYKDEKLLCQQKMPKNLLKREISPVVSLYSRGDIIQFID